ncbi:hypothetical protein B0O80DRAFT_182231 [Mortierella sp. GBAus27b]|nr:hypothetical protein B0O80DRAFT_182231 [Mortierella sp. GBAus27b]
MHDRMLFLLSHMIGMSVEITVKNGSKYEGIFHTAFTEGELTVILRLAKVVSGKDKKDDTSTTQQFIILAKDCMAINALGVDFIPHERAGSERGERDGFKTDTDISRPGELRERDLQKWAPEDHIAFESIEESVHNGRAGWDQFAANERLFGVTTDFDEEIYTTKLDRTGADFKAREQHAIQIANEIQQSVSNNVHMREERGLAVDDSGLDEEDLYGAVVRDPPPVVASNKYVAPALRRQQQQQQDQQRRSAAPAQSPQRTSPSPSQPSTTQTTTSQTTKPPAQQTTPPAPVAQSTSSQESTSTDQVPVSVTTTATVVTATAIATATPSAPASPSVTKPTEGATITRSNSTKGSSSNAQFNLNDLRTHNPVSALLNPATIQRSKQQQIPEYAVDSKQIEDNLAKFAQTAKSFATNERPLVSQTKMGLTQRKTELYQKEKDGLAAELKQFHLELNKKLNTPVPNEVKEIFSKKRDSSDKGKASAAAGTTDKQHKTNDDGKEADKEKSRDNEHDQEDKDRNQDRSVAETKQARDSTDPPKSTASTAAPTSNEKTAPEKPGLGSPFKLNAKASVFKPNVNAAPFTPGDKKTSTTTSTTQSVADKNQFFGKTIKKGPIALKETMSSPFKDGQTTQSPVTVTPTWPYGQRPFRHLFQVTGRYDDDMYTQGMVQHGGNGAGYYAMAAPYNYPSGQFGLPQMTMAGPSHMVPFIGTAGPVPFSQAPPPGMPHTGAGPGFPQLAPTSAPHYAPQGFPPGRSNMIPPSGLHIPMYPYAPTGTPVMMPYPRDIMPPLGPNGMIMHQRPMGMDPQMMHYPTSIREGSEGDNASSEPASSS